LKGFFDLVERSMKAVLTNPFLHIGTLLSVAAIKAFFPGNRDEA
jgi:hypothetical protein